MISEKLKQSFIDTMLAKKLATSTRKSYLSELLAYNDYFSDADIRFISRDDIIKYLAYLALQGYSESKINSAINAVKFFKEKTLRNKRLSYFSNIRPKNSQHIPQILTSEQIWGTIDTIKNIKHKAIIAFIFTHGLRISELRDFKIAHFDIATQTIWVRNSKGRKDRSIPLHKKCRAILEVYYRSYKPQVYLFNGIGENNPQYSCTSIAKIVKKYFSKFNKNITPHSLRHSYATALRELGVDLDDISKLLGHASTKTTEIYNHTSYSYKNKLPQV